MPKKLDSKVTAKLSELYWQLMSPAAARRVREDFFSADDRRRAQDGKLASWNVVDLWAEFRGVSQPRAIIELACGIDLITYAKFRRLLLALGEEGPTPDPPDRPVWDKQRCELRFHGRVIRKVRGLKAASNLVAILDAFQEQDWPSHTFDPLPDGKDSQRLRETIRTLNQGLKVIQFAADGSGEGITWKPK